MQTLIPGALTILSAYPDPPFDVMKDGIATGFDVELMRAVCGRLSLELRPLSYKGENFNDIFTGLAQGTCDAVISGTTIHRNALRSCDSRGHICNSTRVSWSIGD